MSLTCSRMRNTGHQAAATDRRAGTTAHDGRERLDDSGHVRSVGVDGSDLRGTTGAEREH